MAGFVLTTHRPTSTWIALWIGIVATLCSARTFAIDGDRELAELHHTVWHARDGAPSTTTCMAQTTDGYLWLCAANGLYRFDGMTFERFEPADGGSLLSTAVYALLSTPDGLWIGYGMGGVGFIQNDRIVNHPPGVNGLPPGSPYGLVLEPGTLWVGTTSGLAKFDGSSWHRMGADRGFPAASVNDMTLDGKGALWVATAEQGALVRRAGTDVFQQILPSAASESSLSTGSDGTVWLADKSGVRSISSLPPRWIFRSSGADLITALSDRGGNSRMVWSKRGLLRLQSGGAAVDRQRLTRPAGFSNNDVFTSLFEDREGNVWVGTENGVHRLRDSGVADWPDLSDVAGIAGCNDGRIWVVANEYTLYELQPGRAPVEYARPVTRAPDTRVLHCDLHGRMWLGSDGGSLSYSSPNGFVSVSPPAEIVRRGVTALATDRDGAPWASFVRSGIYRWAEGRWSLQEILADQPREPTLALLKDSRGRMWVGYEGSRLAVVDRQAIHVYAAADGLDVGHIYDLYERGPNLWIAGAAGLALRAGERFISLHAEEKDLLVAASGVLETERGDVWLNGPLGAVQILQEEIERARADPRYRVKVRLFDRHDGANGGVRPTNPRPSLVQGSDGRLWFARTEGVFWIDPKHIPHNSLPPPVTIRALRADDRLFRVPHQVKLHPETLNVQIDYTAPSLTVGERVRFRYRLEGWDQEWQDVGGRRQAFYTNLGPGNYRFQVIAANNDGVWNETGATLDFEIPPTFVQTRWFAALCVLAGVALLWGLYLLRLRQIAGRMRARMEERLAERERISRELHDTLLQGMQGLILTVQSVTERIPAGTPERNKLDQVLDRADKAWVEGRDRVSALRAASQSRLDLSQTLTQLAKELAQDSAVAIEVVVEGAPRRLYPIVQEEATMIGREAMLNALRHAQATRIDIAVSYGRKEFCLRCLDNGRGIDAQVLQAGGREGHWGLVGMRERAEKMRAQLRISSRPGAGTEIELKIRAALAYSSRP